MERYRQPLDKEEKFINVDQRLDQIIQDVENDCKEELGFWLGVKFSQEEKRLLIGIFPDRNEILAFYSVINNSKNISGIKENYERKKQNKEICIPWWNQFTKKVLRDNEVDMLWGIINKVKQAISNSRVLQEELLLIDSNSAVSGAKKENFQQASQDKKGINREEKKLIELLGGKKAMTLAIKTIINKYKQSNEINTLKQKIKDQSFIIEVADRLLGKGMHSFYSSMPSGEKKQKLYNLVKNCFLENL